MKAGAIIQARTGSERLPGKVLMEILGKSVLEYVIERVRKAGLIDKIVVATSQKRDDLRIADLARALGVDVYRGSEDDVLDRYYQAARLYGVGHIVRITADCPLIDPKVINNIIKCYFHSKADYCSNVLERTFPDGEDVEVFSFSALEKAWRDADSPFDREHVVPYIRRNTARFKLAGVKMDRDLSRRRWTLDNMADFEFIKAAIEALYPVNPDFDIEDILIWEDRRGSIKRQRA